MVSFVAIAGGVAAAIVIFIIAAILNASAPSAPAKTSLHDVIFQNKESQAAIIGATIEANAMRPIFGMVTGGPPCISELTTQQVNASKLGTVLTDAESQRRPSGNGEAVIYNLTTDELMTVSKNLCLYEYQIGRYQDPGIQNYLGWIEVKSSNDNNSNLRYAYSIQVYRNVTEQNLYTNVTADYKGPMPTHTKVKVYIFAGHVGFFDDNRIFKYVDNDIVPFEPVILRPFTATNVGIVDTYTSTIVVPNGIKFYIDKEVKKTDGSPVTIKDLKYVSFSEDFGYSSFGAPNDYKDTSLQIVWFVVDAKDVARIDAHLDQIRSLIDSEVSNCSEFIQVHPERQGSPCPPVLSG